MASCVISRIISRSALSVPHRPLLVAAFLGKNRLSPSAPSAPLVRNFSTGTASSSSTPQQQWCYTGLKPSKSDLKVGLDFQHWRVLVEEPVGDPTRDQIIDSYIGILATVIGSKADTRLKIYSVSTKYYFEFGVLVPEDVAVKLIGVPHVLRVIPDIYYSVDASSYGGEPFKNGQAAPYEDRFHNWFVRLNAKPTRVDTGENVISPFWSKSLRLSKKIPGKWAYNLCEKLYYKVTLPKKMLK